MSAVHEAAGQVRPRRDAHCIPKTNSPRPGVRGGHGSSCKVPFEGKHPERRAANRRSPTWTNLAARSRRTRYGLFSKRKRPSTARGVRKVGDSYRGRAPLRMLAGGLFGSVKWLCSSPDAGAGAARFRSLTLEQCPQKHNGLPRGRDLGKWLNVAESGGAQGADTLGHPSHRNRAKRGASTRTSARHRPHEERPRNPTAAIARTNIESQHINFIPRIVAEGHSPRNGVVFQGDVGRALWRAHQSWELHELPLDVIESGAAAVSFSKAGDVIAVLQPEPPERLQAKRRVHGSDAEGHASPMEAGSPVA